MSFSIEVKSDPNGTLKGVYSATFSDTSLRLQKKGKADVVEIPVGTTATHEQATVRFDYNDTSVSMRVLGLTVDNNLLAADLASFLSGQREEPELDEYRVPRLLAALSLLPLGIPVITLGGAIPAGIGFGLAIACLMIAKNRDTSVPVRAVLILVTSVVGYVGTFAMLAGLLNSQ